MNISDMLNPTAAGERPSVPSSKSTRDVMSLSFILSSPVEEESEHEQEDSPCCGGHSHTHHLSQVYEPFHVQPLQPQQSRPSRGSVDLREKDTADAILLLSFRKVDSPSSTSSPHSPVSDNYSVYSAYSSFNPSSTPSPASAVSPPSLQSTDEEQESHPQLRRVVKTQILKPIAPAMNYPVPTVALPSSTPSPSTISSAALSKVDNDKRWRCHICGRGFSQKSNYEVHVRVHTQEKPYICNFEGCGLGFISSTYLRAHMRGHLNIRPFVCEICNKAFTRSTNAHQHVRMVHRLKESIGFVRNLQKSGKLPGTPI